VLRDVEIARNHVLENLDVGIGMATSVLLADAGGSRNVVERVSLRDNDCFTPPGFGRLNSGFFLSGAQLVLGAGGASDADHHDGLVVERNVLDGVATGALVFAGYVGAAETAAEDGGPTT
jgi:hypothetical protein